VLWQGHEENHIHIMDDVGWGFDFDHILWKCGICGKFGLSVRRRHVHIINHWQEGYTMQNWKDIPAVMPLSSLETSWLVDLSQDAFQSTAEAMLRGRPRKVLHSDTTSRKDLLIIQHPPKEGKSPLDTTAKEHKNFHSGRLQAAPEPARSGVRGLFASIRNKFLRSKKKAPKPLEVQQVHSFGPEEARSQYYHHQPWAPSSANT
jgi:hypothetical protein